MKNYYKTVTLKHFTTFRHVTIISQTVQWSCAWIKASFSLPKLQKEACNVYIYIYL